MSAAALALVPAKLTFAEQIDEVEHIVALVEMLDSAEELTPERYEELQADLIEAISGARETVDNVSRALAAFEACASAAAVEEKRLAARRAGFERRAKRLEQYVLATLEASGLKKMEGHTSTLALRANPPAVEVTEGAELAPEFLRIPAPPAPAPDKAAIKEALKAGREIPGCRLTQTTRLVRS